MWVLLTIHAERSFKFRQPLVVIVEAFLLFKIDTEQRSQNYPWKFYSLTEGGREFLEKHNLLAAEETLQQIYHTISDTPEKMVKYQNAPRPDDI